MSSNNTRVSGHNTIGNSKNFARFLSAQMTILTGSTEMGNSTVPLQFRLIFNFGKNANKCVEPLKIRLQSHMVENNYFFLLVVQVSLNPKANLNSGSHQFTWSNCFTFSTRLSVAKMTEESNSCYWLHEQRRFGEWTIRSWGTPVASGHGADGGVEVLVMDEEGGDEVRGRRGRAGL